MHTVEVMWPHFLCNSYVHIHFILFLHCTCSV